MEKNKMLTIARLLRDYTQFLSADRWFVYDEDVVVIHPKTKEPIILAKAGKLSYRLETNVACEIFPKFVLWDIVDFLRDHYQVDISYNVVYKNPGQGFAEKRVYNFGYTYKEKNKVLMYYDRSGNKLTDYENFKIGLADTILSALELIKKSKLPYNG